MGSLKSLLIEKLANATENNHVSRKKLSLSIVSLVLATVVLISATYCWLAIRRSDGYANNISLVTGNGLRVNDLGDTMKNISDTSYLLPASSYDGRNLFFPADGTDFSTTKTNMTFRSANAGDRNYDYVQLDFNLTAEANYTSIYLDKETSLKIDVPSDASADYKAACEKAQKAIRAAIFYEGMTTPVVFNAQNNPSSVDAVKDIDRTTGRFLESGKQVAVPFKDYSYGKRQLAMLKQGETKPFSLIIWLEGTDEENCTSDYVMLKQLKLNLKFVTSWDNTETIKFTDKDNIVRNILTGDPNNDNINGNPAYTLQLYYSHDYRDNNNNPQNVTMKFNMYKNSTSDNYWTCTIPDSAVSDITFQIVDNSDSGRVVYEWSQTDKKVSTKNRGTATVYYVDAVNGVDSATANYGHWYDGEIEDQGDGHDIGEVDDDW